MPATTRNQHPTPRNAAPICWLVREGCGRKKGPFSLPIRPTVSLGVIALVSSNCGYYRGSNRAPRCTLIRGARGDTERARETSTTPPSAARSAVTSVRACHCKSPPLTPKELHRSGPLSRLRTPRWRTREEKQSNRLTIPRDALPTRPSSFRLLAMASPTGCSLEAMDVTGQ
jgi:hypothetical protein